MTKSAARLQILNAEELLRVCPHLLHLETSGSGHFSK
jgi:hypothetical protein